MSAPDVQLLNAIGHLYEAVSDEARWGDFLRAASQLFAAPYANLLHLDQRHPELSVSLVTGFEAHSLERQQWGARKQVELQEEDPRMQWAKKYPNLPLRCTEMMPVSEFRALRIYQELLQPAGIEYSLFVQCSDEAEKFTGLSFHRGPDQQAFSEAESQQFGLIIPHLRRAFSIQQQLFDVRQKLDSAYQVLPSSAVNSLTH